MGSKNVLADALSRMYSNDSSETKRTQNGFTYHDVMDNDTTVVVCETSSMTGINAVSAGAVSKETISSDKDKTPETSKEFAC